jgi:cytochrome c peroxidase
MDLTPAQSRGRDVYNIACEACHGGATTLQVVNRQVHDLAFLQLKPDGNVLYDTTVQPPQPVLRPQPNNEFLNAESLAPTVLDRPWASGDHGRASRLRSFRRTSASWHSVPSERSKLVRDEPVPF